MNDKPKILIIDDDPMIRKTLSGILRVKGYEVVTAKDGTEGIAEISRSFVNLALVDLQLPDVPGIEVLARMKAASPFTEAVILTGHATMESAIEATNRGAFSYLLKPCDVQQLLLHIHHALDKQHAAWALRKSEERLAEAQRIAHLGNWKWDVVTDGTWWSDELYRMLGLKPQEITPSLEKFLSFVHPDDREYVRKSVHELQRQHKPYSLDFRIIRTDGAERIFHAEGKTTFDKNGNLLSMMGITQDITERKQTEKALLESEERFRAVAETAADAIICLEEPGLVNFWNTTAEKMFGYSAVEAKGMALHDVITPESFREKAYKGMTAFFQTGTGPIIGKTRELLALRKDGAEFPIELSVSAMNIRDKWQATAIIRDISQRKQTEEALLWELKVNTALADLAKSLITSKSIETTSSLVLEKARQLTESEFGFVGYVDPQTGHFVSPTLTGEVCERCQMHDKMDGFQMSKGLFGWVLKNRKPLLSNAPSEDPRSEGTPVGHVPIHRFLSVPSLLGETMVGQIAVANSGRNYTDKDAQFLERLAILYAIAVQRTREEDKLHHEKGLTARLLRLIAEDVEER